MARIKDASGFGWVFALVILTASGFLMELTFTMITPFLPLYLVKELDVAPADVNMWSGAVFAVTFFISGVLGPVWGALSDRGSRKLMAIRASVSLAITYTLCGIVRTPEELFAARFLMGLAGGLYPALLALVAGAMPAKRIGFSMGMLQGGMTLGGIAGPFLGGVLSEAVGMRASFYAGGLALAVVTVFLILFVHEPKYEITKTKGRVKLFDFGVLKNPVVARVMTCGLIVNCSIFALQPILPLYIGELMGTMENITVVAGTVFSCCAVPVLIASPILGALGQKHGFAKVLVICLTLSSFLVAAQALAHDVVSFTVIRLIGGFSIAGIMPMINAILSDTTQPDEKGRVFGLNFLFGHIGMSVGPLLSGWASDFTGYPAVIALSGFIMLPVALYLIAIMRRGQFVR